MQLTKDGLKPTHPADTFDQVFHSYYHSDSFAFMAGGMVSDETGRDVGTVSSLVRGSEWGSVFGQVTGKFGST